MVGNGNATHAILDGLIHQTGDTGLPVEQGVLGMNV